MPLKEAAKTAAKIYLSPGTQDMLFSNRPRIRFFTLGSLAALLLLLVLPSPRASAQAYATAEKKADIFVFGGFSDTSPDYGPTWNKGATVGVDYTRYLKWSYVPSLELRATFGNGSTVNEHTYMGGLRVHKRIFRRFAPYADALFGLGTITYPERGSGGTIIHVDDSGFAYSLGGGVDIGLVHNFMLKADFQQQFWNLGENTVEVPSGANFTLSPKVLTIGVSYRIPFHSDVR